MPEKVYEAEGYKYHISWRDVLSSNVKRLGVDYDAPEGLHLFVEYDGNRIYMYKMAGAYLYFAMRALSTGEYIEKQIKPNYECVRVVSI